MSRMLDPFQFLVLAIAGWMNHRQLHVIEYLREENRILREQLGDRRVRFNDDQRRRLAVRAKGLGRKLLAEVASLVTPDTLLAWHRKLIAFTLMISFLVIMRNEILNGSSERCFAEQDQALQTRLFDRAYESLSICV